MPTNRHTRLGDACGLVAAVFIVAGFVISAVSGRAAVTLGSSREEIAQALADPVGAGLWIGLAVESIGLLAVVLFGAALAARMTGWASFALTATATVYTAVSLAAMGAIGVYERQAGLAADPAVAHAFVSLAGILYAGTWLVGALLLALAAASGLFGRALTWIAAGVAFLSVAGTAVPESELAQIPPFLQLVWIGVASIVLIRRPTTGESVAAPRRAPLGEPAEDSISLRA